MAGPDPLAHLLGGADLAWLRERVRRRLEWGRPATGSTSLDSPSEGQVAAIARLLGRPYRPVGRLRVDLDEVSGVLRRAGVADDVAHAVRALDGPVEDRAAAERRLAGAWEAVHQRLVEAAGPPLAQWATGVIRSGLVKRLAGGDPSAGWALVDGLGRVLAAVPADQVFRSRFAADLLGDAHALDHGRGLSTLVISALRARFGAPVLDGAEGRVEVWAAAGILVGDLTSTVLVAGFGGHPRVWTLREVVRAHVELAAAQDRVVWAVENPTVLAEAVEALGDRCPPLVCVSGQPTVAVLALLRELADVASEVRYHGDFDWAGLRVANRLIQRVGVVPWQFTAADYTAAIAAGRGGPPLREDAVDADWDPALAGAMRQAGVAVEEESVLTELLRDLRG